MTIEVTTYKGTESEILFEAIDGLFEPGQALKLKVKDDTFVGKVRNMVNRYRRTRGVNILTRVEDGFMFIIYKGEKKCSNT